MKKSIIFTSLLLTVLSFNGLSQEGESNTIDAQFTDLIKSSNSYQNYKVIKASEMGVLQKNVLDSIASLQTTIDGSDAIISEQKSKIDGFTEQVDSLKIELEETQQKVENIEFLGVPTQKSSYNSIMWTFVFVLLALSLVLFFIFKKGQRNTKDAREKLASTEIELEGLRKRSLEREQKVRRELQDEINKNRLKKE